MLQDKQEHCFKILRTRTTVNNCEIMYRLLSHFPHFSLYI
jgi:hypothetical protein